MRFRRRSGKQRMRPIGEAEAYHHSYGEQSADVRRVKLPPRPARFKLRISGEDLRRRFQERLDSREPDDRDG